MLDGMFGLYDIHLLEIWKSFLKSSVDLIWFSFGSILAEEPDRSF